MDRRLQGHTWPAVLLCFLGQKAGAMSLGTLLAFVVLILVVIAFVFAAAMPPWLPLLMIGLLALAMLVGSYVFPARP